VRGYQEHNLSRSVSEWNYLGDVGLTNEDNLRMTGPDPCPVQFTSPITGSLSNVGRYSLRHLIRQPVLLLRKCSNTREASQYGEPIHLQPKSDTWPWSRRNLGLPITIKLLDLTATYGKT
jgi:hypothetical protein